MTRTVRTSLYIIIAAVLVTGVILSVFAIRQRGADGKDKLERTFLFENRYEVRHSNDFMVLEQHAIDRDITKPITYPSPDSQIIDYDCFILTVVVGGDRTVSINSFEVGTLDDLKPLANKLTQILRQRAEYHVYRRGFETRTDLRVAERIRRTIVLRPDESVPYGDVAQLIELLKQLHADPIGVQTNHLQTWTPPCDARPANVVARQTWTPLIAAPSNKSLDRSHGKRVSHHHWSGVAAR